MATFAKSTFNVAVYAACRPTYPPVLFEHIFAYHRQGDGGSGLKGVPLKLNSLNGTSAAPSPCVPQPRWEHAVDLGCGTGQATRPLSGLFRRVTCIDPSAGMLEKAKMYLVAPGDGDSRRANDSGDKSGFPTMIEEGERSARFSFHQGSAEDLRDAIPDSGSVDLAIAAQACHWFDWEKVWPEMQRILRPGGTAAFWVYGEMEIPQFPTLRAMITHYAQGDDPNSTSSVGTYFQRPGRTILERLLVDVPAPSQVLAAAASQHGGCKLTDFQHHFFSDQVPAQTKTATSTESGVAAGERFSHAPIMRAAWTWLDLLGYLRTWSALHSYHKRFPEDLSAPEDTRFLDADLQAIRRARQLSQVEGGGGGSGGGYEEEGVRGGDIAIRFWKDLREEAAGRGGSSGLLDPITVEWPVSLLLARKV